MEINGEFERRRLVERIAVKALEYIEEHFGLDFLLLQDEEVRNFWVKLQQQRQCRELNEKDPAKYAEEFIKRLGTEEKDNE